ncbi:MAG: ROK family protein [Planctomycetota bacterium]
MSSAPPLRLGFDLSEGAIGIAAVHPTEGMTFRVVASDSYAGEHHLETIVQAIEDLRRQAPAGSVDTSSIGLALAPERSDLLAILAARLQTPIAVESPGRCVVLAEQTFGRERGPLDLAYVDVGEHLSTGVLIDGRILSGTKGDGGEGGHTLYRPGGLDCACGMRGCFSAYASELALRNQFARQVQDGRRTTIRPEPVCYATLLDAAAHGDRLAGELLYEAEFALAVLLYNLHRLFEPRALLVGGMALRRTPLLLERLRAKMSALTGRDWPLEAPALGREAAALGASILAAYPSPQVS